VRHHDYGWVSDLEVDGQGNVYVLSDVLIKYTADGDTTVAAGGWTRPSGTAIAVDYQDDVFIVAAESNYGTGVNFMVRKYNTDGDMLWQSFYGGPDNLDDYPKDVAVDASGNAYVVGTSASLTTDIDFVTIKYTSDGDTAESAGGWIRRFTDLEYINTNHPLLLCVSETGEAHVAGTSCPAGSYHTDPFIIKYTASGDTSEAAGGWVRNVRVGTGFGWGSDYLVAMCLDPDGNVYVAGIDKQGIPDPQDPYFHLHNYFIAMYTENGLLNWTHGYGSTTGNDEPTDIAADGFGNVYVTGRSHDDGTSDYDYVTLGYDTDGNPKCDIRFTGMVGTDDEASALAIDSIGNIYVTGRSTRLNPFYLFDFQYATLKFVPTTQTPQQELYYDQWSQGDDAAKFIRIDNHGNIVVTGTSCLSNPVIPCVSVAVTTIKYSPKSPVSAAEIRDGNRPVYLELHQNHPNPFNTVTTIQFALTRSQHVVIEVFDILGRMVTTLVSETLPLGNYSTQWDGRDAEGQQVASGVYFYRLRADDRSITRKMILLE